MFEPRTNPADALIVVAIISGGFYYLQPLDLFAVVVLLSLTLALVIRSWDVLIGLFGRKK